MKHTRTVLSEDTEADMGIGTLYVLIATVLVATVAAGVLLSVAQSAQNQALDTAGLALTTVASGLEIHEIRGDRDSTGDGAGDTEETIQFLELTVTLVPGSPVIAMENVIIEIRDDDTERVLRFDASSSTTKGNQWDSHDQDDSDDLKALAGAQKYTAEELRDPLDTFYQSTDTDNPDFAISKGTLVRIFIDLQAGGLDLSPQETMVITILPKHGAPTDIWFETPEVYTERFVELVD